MLRNKSLVAEKRNYLVTTVAQAKEITTSWLSEIQLSNVVSLGLPEVDDRYHVWRIPLCTLGANNKIGEVVIDAYTTEILLSKTTKPEMLETRLLKKDEVASSKRQSKVEYPISSLRNTIGQGDCVTLIDEMSAACGFGLYISPLF